MYFLRQVISSITILFCLAIPAPVYAAVCDVDNNGAVDSNDVQLIFTASNTPASGPDDPRDADHDGFITINDASLCTLQCSLPACAVSDTSNTPPVANAGPDQFIEQIGMLVTLDGSGSNDVDGNALTYSWSFISRPEGSTASLSDSAAVQPTFTVDVRGDYILQLIVNDGTANSNPDTVTITTGNAPPVANAGADQTALVGDVVTLNGSGSSDADGDALTFNWTFSSRPAGSGASLVNPTAVYPGFTVDVPGSYVIQLIVNDGVADSAPDSVIVTTGNSIPVADAGPDQSVQVGDTVTLDGSGSSDADGDELSFNWSFVSRPPTSVALLSDATAVTPNFVVDVSGTYILQLMVNDGTVSSSADTVTIITTNTPPLANAGPDQTAFIGDTVTLDGSASSDVDGDELSFNWSFVSRPAGSATVLSDPGAVRPSFEVDEFGVYVLQLIVNDGHVNSVADTVTIVTENTPPVANAGLDQTAFVGDTVTLNGSASSDADGNTLSYHWSFTSRPEGSVASLSDPSAVTPTFDVDAAGSYVLQLVVNDGIVNSEPDTVIVSTVNSTPVANAGPDNTAFVGETVILDGSASSDADGDTLSYRWSFISRPVDSNAALSNPTQVNPSFEVDLAGTYVIQLIVNDGTVDSDPDSVVIITVNRAPIANAGSDQIVNLGDTVTLDGSGSSDPDGDVLTYSWSFTSRPEGSEAILSGDTSVNPDFVADVVGVYVLQLIVSDGVLSSLPVSVTVSVSQAAIQLSLINTDLVGVGRPAQLRVTLLSPAPAGGTTVTVTSDHTDLLVVEAPATTFIPAGESIGEVTLIGVDAGTATVRGNAPGYTEGTLDVGVTFNLISVATTLNIPLGHTVSYPVTIAPDPAPPGGVVINLLSGNSAVAELQSSTVLIPEGLYSANVTILGAASGTTYVNASNPNYAADTGLVNVTADLNIQQDSFTISNGFPRSITIDLESDGEDVSAPAPITVTLTPDDPSCVSVTSPVVIDTGTVRTTALVSYGGSASLPCSSVVTASAINATSDTVTVTVNPAPPITFSYLYSSNVGSGLRTERIFAILAEANHGGTTVRIQSSDPSRMLVSAEADTEGTEYVDIPVLDGSVQARFYVHGMEGVTGTVNVVAMAPGFVTGTLPVEVQQPGVGASALHNTTTLSANSVVGARVGLVAGGNVYLVQEVRPGGVPLVVTISNSNAAVAQLVSSSASGQVLTTVIEPGNYFAPYTLETGAVLLDPLAAGVTTLTASIPGFISVSGEIPTVTITAPNILHNFIGFRIGGGQEIASYALLGATEHGGVTVHIESADPSVMVLAPDSATLGTGSIDIFVPNGENRADYVVKGQPGALGTVEFTASAAGFNDGVGNVVIVEPVIRLFSQLAVTTLSPNSWVSINIGTISYDGTELDMMRNLRGDLGPLSITLSNSQASVGQLVTSSETGQTVTVQLPPGQSYISAPAASGGVEFDPLGAGTTTVSATAANYTVIAESSRTITVSAPQITHHRSNMSVGSGLRTNTPNTWLDMGTSSHGGVTLHLQSSDPSLALVSVEHNATPAESVDIFVPDGQNRLAYFVNGMEGVTGNVTISASAPGFLTGTASVDVVQPALRIDNLQADITTLSANDDFNVTLGIPTADNSGLLETQQIRIGGTSLTASITNSTAIIGRLVVDGSIGQSATVQIDPGQSTSPMYGVGTVAFDPLTSGSTIVAATIPGFISTDLASRSVMVDAPLIVHRFPDMEVGAGLLFQNSWATLGASEHSGVTVRIESSNPSIALVSAGPSEAGAAFVDVTVPNGSTTVIYYVHGVEGVTGSITLTASADGFVDGSATVNVVQPSLEIVALDQTSSTGADDDLFIIRIGPPNPTHTGLATLQQLRPGVSPLVVTVSNSNPSVGQLVTSAATGQTVNIEIQPTQYQSAGTLVAGGVAFDAMAAGNTTITATSPGYITTTNASRMVTVEEGTTLASVIPISQESTTTSGGCSLGRSDAIDPTLPLLILSGVVYLVRRRSIDMKRLVKRRK